MLRFIHLKGVMATIDLSFSPSSTKRTSLTILPLIETISNRKSLMLHKEMNKHLESVKKRPDLIIYFITICGKSFNIFVNYHCNWQLLRA